MGWKKPRVLLLHHHLPLSLLHFWRKCKNGSAEERQPFQQIVNFGLNWKYKQLKEERISESIQDLWLGDEFSDLTPKAKYIKGKIDKLHFIRIKSFCYLEDTVKKVKRKTSYRLLFRQQTTYVLKTNYSRCIQNIETIQNSTTIKPHKNN